MHWRSGARAGRATFAGFRSPHGPSHGGGVSAERVGTLVHGEDAGPQRPRHRLAPVGVAAGQVGVGPGERGSHVLDGKS
jgi:hypothetical protein